MKYFKLKHLIFSATFLLFIVGCKSRQLTPTTTQTSDCLRIVDEVVNRQPQFSSMNISKMDLILTAKNRDFALKGGIKMQTDSFISISLQPFLGIEAYRLDFYPNRFVLVDKMNRRFTENSYDLLNYKYGVAFNFRILQAVFSNQIFTLGETEAKLQPFVIQGVGDTITIGCYYQIFTQKFQISPKKNITRTEILCNQAAFSVDYADHAKLGKNVFPKQVKTQFQAGDERLTLRLNINKIEFDEPLLPPTPLSDRYQKVNFSDLLPF